MTTLARSSARTLAIPSSRRLEAYYNASAAGRRRTAYVSRRAHCWRDWSRLQWAALLEKIMTKACVFLISQLLFTAFVYGSSDTITQVAELTASDGIAGDNFGFSVASYGNTAVVSAPSFGALGPGAAYVFTNTQGLWTQIAKLTPSDGYAGDRFGYAVTMNQNTIAVGNDTDAVYVFVEPAGGWTSMTETAELETNGGNLGFTLGISSSGGMVATAATYGVVYQEPANGWENANKFNALLATCDPNERGYVTSIAIGNDFIVQGTADPPAACVFAPGAEIQNNRVQPTALLSASDNALGFGYSCNASGNTVAVAASAGVYVFVEPKGGWVNVDETAKLTNPSPVPNYALGQVAIYNGIIGFGVLDLSPGANPTQGAVLVYAEGPGGWTDSQKANFKVTASDGMSGDYFGTSISISTSGMIVGAPNHSVNGNAGQGAAYIFDRIRKLPAYSFTPTAQP